MTREQELLSIVGRRVAQGFSADAQYAALNAARGKRKQKRAKNLQQMISGGVKQVPIINGRSSHI